VEPQRPGIDINDPKVLRGAKAAATRRNNKARKKLAAERAALPLYAEQIPAEPAHLVTPEEVVESRKLHQISTRETIITIELMQLDAIHQYKNQIFALVGESEYTEFYARSLATSMPQDAYWHLLLEDIKRRSDEMPPNMELVLIWLCDWEGEPPTTGDLHALRGDGMTFEEIGEALRWLEKRHYAEGHRIRPCKYATERLKDILPDMEHSSTPFTAADAGRAYINS